MQRYLPPGLSGDRLVATVGLISDTHMPQRWPALPATLATCFAGVDLILHAGDVGELWVLDRLSAIAPVVAVSGNDDTPEAHRELPTQQIVALGGLRVLLTHSHRPDPAAERATRSEDAWEPKLAYRAALARRAGARVVVFGHMHVPLVHHYDGILLVNPGAIAFGNFFTRQRRQTVALLFVDDEGHATVSHVDLAQPEQTFQPELAWEEGFSRAFAAFGESILAPDLASLPARVAKLRFADPQSLFAAFRTIAMPCWTGAKKTVSHDDLQRSLHTATLDPEDRDLLLSLLDTL